MILYDIAHKTYKSTWEWFQIKQFWNLIVQYKQNWVQKYFGSIGWWINKDIYLFILFYLILQYHENLQHCCVLATGGLCQSEAKATGIVLCIGSANERGGRYIVTSSLIG